MIQLRNFQIDAKNSVYNLVRAGRRRLILCCPTGAGKTVCAASILRDVRQAGKYGLFLAHQRELINQTSEKLHDAGVGHGIIMSGEEDGTPGNIQLASKDTLFSRAIRRNRMSMPKADWVIVDEAHHALAKTYDQIIDHYKDAVILGLSATPARKTGKGLGCRFQAIHQATTIRQLIGMGYLVPGRIYAPYTPDMKGVKASGGDFNAPQVGKRMDKPELVGDIVSHWMKLGQDRQTIVFASGISHSMHIRDEFIKAGVRADHIDGSAELEDREELFARFKAGRSKVLCSCSMLLEGVDIPSAACGVMARPTQSFVLFRQAVGRLMRTYPAMCPTCECEILWQHDKCNACGWAGPIKKDYILLDHAGNCLRHGLPEDDVEWSLEETENVQEKAKKKQDENPMRCCPSCYTIWAGDPVCPTCGFVLAKMAAPKERKGGLLVEISGGGTAAQKVENFQAIWNKCLAITAYKGRNFRSAAGMFISMTKGLRPWELRLRNMPGRHQYDMLVSEVFPQYGRRRA